MKKKILVSMIIILMMLFGCTKDEPAETQKQKPATTSTQELTPDEAKAIAKEAYVYGFPMVMNYKTMYMYVVNEHTSERQCHTIQYVFPTGQAGSP